MKAMGRGSLSSVLGAIVNIGWSLAWVILVVGVLTLVLSPYVDPPRIEFDFKLPVAFTLDPATHRVTAPNVTRAELTDTQGTIHFLPRDTRSVAFGAVGMIAFSVVSLWILGNLKGVFGTLRQGRPFVPANAARMRRIAWGILALQIPGSVIVYWSSSTAISSFNVEGLTLSPRLDFDPIGVIGALIMFVIAEVFREGSRLDEEQSLTV
jgi:hypothetical protein